MEWEHDDGCWYAAGDRFVIRPTDAGLFVAEDWQRSHGRPATSPAYTSLAAAQFWCRLRAAIFKEIAT